jgi:hypothetical protein
MTASRMISMWQHEPTLPPEGRADLDSLRPIQVVRVRTAAERARATGRAPSFVRLMFVDAPERAEPVDLPARPR